MHVYDTLKFELVHDQAFVSDDNSRQWVERMIDYNVPGGKMVRAFSVVDSCQLMKGEKMTEDEVFLACALGWCTEWLQASFVVLDDIMDASHTRRGRSCWYRLPEVGMTAVNDGLMLRNHVHRILKEHFHDKAYYMQLVDLFNEAEFQTVCGEMIDIIATLDGKKDLSKYTMSLQMHNDIMAAGSKKRPPMLAPDTYLNLFTMKIHHNDEFSKPLERRYKFDELDYVDIVDSDMFFLYEWSGMLKELGLGDNNKIPFTYYRIHVMSMDDCLVSLMADVGVIKLLNYVIGCKEIEEGLAVGETELYMRGVLRPKGSFLKFVEGDIAGVMPPMVYISMLFSWFAWHVEDHDFHNIKYMHKGVGKTRYCAPRDATMAFEDAVTVYR
nr:chrysanthemyl diphosphate synthase [Tanacetum cinerariifolium]